jgi:poly(3-hydroxybutyrate) depolymerase
MLRTSILAALLLGSTLPVFAARVEKRTLTSRGQERTYYLFVPDGITAEKPAPLLITLHGSGRNGSVLVEKWKGLAAKAGIVVAGPDSTDPAQWASPQDGPRLLHDLVEELKGKHPIDTRRIYLFGHSGGACFALQIGLLESEYFAAVAVHAGALQPAAYPLTSYATRKVPFALFVGSRDPNFPVSVVQDTEKELAKKDLPVELTIIPNHTHDYYGRSDTINRSVWEFLEKHALTGDPNYTVYSNTE